MFTHVTQKCGVYHRSLKRIKLVSFPESKSLYVRSFQVWIYNNNKCIICIICLFFGEYLTLWLIHSCFHILQILKAETRWQRSAIGQRGQTNDFVQNFRSSPLLIVNSNTNSNQNTGQPNNIENRQQPKINQGFFSLQFLAFFVTTHTKSMTQRFNHIEILKQCCTL
jgi:hypothetical protein